MHIDADEMPKFVLKASVKSLLALYPALLQDLGPRRTREMEEASEMGALSYHSSFPLVPSTPHSIFYEYTVGHF